MYYERVIPVLNVHYYFNGTMLFRRQCNSSNTCTNRRRVSVILHHKCFTHCCSLWQL